MSKTLNKIFNKVEVIEINDERTLDLVLCCSNRYEEHKKFISGMKRRVNKVITKADKEQIIKEECKSHILYRYKLSSEIRDILISRLLEFENKIIIDKSDEWVWEYRERIKEINHILKFSI